jgi:hypothetical protein
LDEEGQPKDQSDQVPFPQETEGHAGEPPPHRKEMHQEEQNPCHHPDQEEMEHTPESQTNS